MQTAIPDRQWQELDKDFAPLAHRHQDPPASADDGRAWTTWLMLGGRGAGKTRLGAEWVRALVHGTQPYTERRHRRIALVGESMHDARGKYLRAEPIAAMYSQSRVKHVDPPPEQLEDQMCDFGLSGLSSGGSPDRLDALVWAVTELTARAHQGPRIRRL